MPRNYVPAATDRARDARKDPSVAEAVMWSILRNSRIGFKFRREHPIGPFRVDFYCREAMLVVELDGQQHDAKRDAARDSFLEGIGLFVYRIPNRSFFALDEEPYRDQIEEIRQLCEERAGREAFSS